MSTAQDFMQALGIGGILEISKFHEQRGQMGCTGVYISNEGLFKTRYYFTVASR